MINPFHYRGDGFFMGEGMFQNREEAGILLSKKLKKYKDSKEVLVLAIPRGGVVVGRQITDNLHLPLSLVVVKKLGAPYNSELAIGAIAPDGVRVVDKELALRVGADSQYINEEIKRKRKEIEEREKKLSVISCRSSVRDKRIVILVDDGVATGATTLAAIKYVKKVSGIRYQVSGIRYQGSGVREEQVLNLLKPETRNLKPEIILAVPVIAHDTYGRLEKEVDEIIALEIPEYFGAVGQFYREFGQVTDEEVVKILSHLSYL